METRGLDAPLHERYLDWLIDVTTLEWGYSFAYREPVVAVLDGRVQTTLGYVIPGVLLAVLLGVVLGLFAALSRDSAFDWSVRLWAYALFGIPAFMFVVYVQFLADGAIPRGAVATVTVAVGLLAGQVRFARAASLEQAGQEFVKLLRAKGANRLLLARHVLRNAAMPIISLSITEVLGVLALNIYVIEEILGIRGLAQASLFGVREGDIALVIWTTMVLVVIGITGNFLQDVLYGYLDPRIRSE